MNERRRALATAAFRQFDQDGNGVVNVEDLKGRFNASFHPDVRSGKKTEEEVLYDFLDTFEQHYALLVRNLING
jgi:Ca2+-binding EF-hand superfamily protein